MSDFFLGIDGGGTKTRCAIADETGKVIGCGLAEGCKADTSTSLERIRQNVSSAVMGALDAAGIVFGDIRSACFGIPGFNGPNDLEKARQMVTFTGLTCPMLMETDPKIAWAGALICRPGVVVVSGNGFDVYGVCEDGTDMKGLGPAGTPLLAGESCEDLEFQILYECLLANQGAPLLRKVLDRIGLETQEAWIAKTREGKFSWGKYRGALLPLAVEAAQEGDDSACHILQSAGRTLGSAAVMVMKYLRIQETEVSFIGGAFEVCGCLLLRPFTASVLSRFSDSRVVSPRLKPVAGALLLAMRASGLALDTTHTENLAEVLAIKKHGPCVCSPRPCDFGDMKS